MRQHQHHTAPLPPNVLAGLRDDPVFRVLTMDGSCWIDPYTGDTVPTIDGWEVAAKAHLLKARPWLNGLQPKPLFELLQRRWFLYLKDNLEFVPVLRLFRAGMWLNPYSGKWQDGPSLPHDPLRVAEHLARLLAGTPEAEAGRMLERRVLEEIALRGPQPSGAVPLPLTDPTPRRAAPVVAPVAAAVTPPRAQPIDGIPRAIRVDATPARVAALPDPSPARGSVREASPRRSSTVADVPPPAGADTGVRRAAARSDHVTLKQALLAMLRRPPRMDGHQLVVHFAPHAPMPRDFYDFIELAPGRLLIVMGHVAGNGPGAALLAGAALDQLRQVAPVCRDLAGIVAELNDAVRCDLVHGCSIGICAAILDTTANRFAMVAAGHPPAVVISMRRDDVLRQLHSTGASLGTLIGQDFLRSLEPVEINLFPGDVVLMPGHGLAHGADPRDPDAGRWAILGTAVECAKKPCGELLERLLARARPMGEPARDDLAAIALRVKDESWLLEARV